MGEEDQSPIRSTLAGNPSFEEALEAFVVGLGERIDLIQDADAEGDFRTASGRARALAAEALELGYPPLEAAAERAAAACASGDPETAHKGIVELTEIVRRVRLGHRGAA